MRARNGQRVGERASWKDKARGKGGNKATGHLCLPSSEMPSAACGIDQKEETHVITE